METIQLLIMCIGYLIILGVAVLHILKQKKEIKRQSDIISEILSNHFEASIDKMIQDVLMSDDNDEEISKQDGMADVETFKREHKKGSSKGVAQYDRFDVFIKNHKSIRKAEKDTGVGRASITKSCKEGSVVKGFKFKYL